MRCVVRVVVFVESPGGLPGPLGGGTALPRWKMDVLLEVTRVVGVGRGGKVNRAELNPVWEGESVGG